MLSICICIVALRLSQRRTKCVCVFADQIQFRLKVYSELYDFQQCNSEYLCSGWSTKLNANNYKQNAVFCCCAVHFTIRFNLSKLWWPSLFSTKKTPHFSRSECAVFRYFRFVLPSLVVQTTLCTVI